MDFFLHGSMSAEVVPERRHLPAWLAPIRHRRDRLHRRGPYIVDTRTPGNSNSGHAYGIDLSAADRRDLIEFLTTL